MAAHVQHHPEDQEFTIDENGAGAELAYSQDGGTIDFTHTFVEEELRGKGLAETLAKAGLAYAREQGLKVRTSCEFMAGYVQQHPEYQDILA
ncbi:N-acetyltransferase [Hymenobacter taeanensis]|uniref:N-acetyltransferase n=1 Tax=Hymenobacter taeanensis TaxID=2735321 RepID=A0A6M6BIW2_9BACT|nr:MULTISPECIES: GNAT family N-acetyltransferase [Hymenobacter]QJX47939.1 N-acetyltransferase [Hymenobacter taeanensis]UOQ82611.1 N-acetyltransferase [Hymenobacter sp. 5414T-23]